MDRATARPLALSGPMGVGKSTVGRRVAELAGVPFVDVDDHVAESAGRSIAEVFRVEGEAAFRARERVAIAALLRSGPKVLSLGGGAVTDQDTRRQLVDKAVLVTLDAPVETIARRLGPEQIAQRPLLAGGDPVERLRTVIAARSEAYAEAHARVSTERTVDEVARDVLALWRRDPVAVALGERTYRVEVGAGVRDQLSPILAQLRGKLLLVSDDRAWPLVGPRLQLPELAGEVILPTGEVNKTVESLARIWDAALDAGFDRRGVILAVGGGVIGDLAGFAAATVLRGVRFVQVPTTLLSMVDASVGGKTAIDRPQGKNLVGAFHQPSAVIADVELLETLPAREVRSGMSEVIKTALIGDAALLERLENLEQGGRDLAPIVRASIAHKARVVATDEHDRTGARAALNFGHTVGHALEAHAGFERLTHGEAVSLGMIAALTLGIELGITPAPLLDRARSLLSREGLPVDLAAEPLAEALPRILSDKKREGDEVAFVLLEGVGRPKNVRLGLDRVRRALGV